MRIDDFLKKGMDFFFSLEITPPDRGSSVNDIYRTIDSLVDYNPAFINVTYHQPHISFKTENGKKIREVYRKKPGTIGVCAAIQSRYSIDAVPHLLCGGMNKWEIEDTIIDMHYLGFDNVFALRGDPVFGMDRFVAKEDGYEHASELVEHISRMNKGVYLDDELEDAQGTDFCIGVAAYPEKHVEATEFDQDIAYLKEKVDKGAHFIVTQMCFDFDLYQNFMEKMRKAGITVPVIPGIRPLVSKKQIEMVPEMFGVSVPDELKEKMFEAKTKKEEFEVGTSFIADLCVKLLENGSPGIHLFTMGKGKSAAALLERLK